MKKLLIGNRELKVKNYYCAQNGGEVIENNTPKLWLYINLTSSCPASCRFCVNPCERKKSEDNFSVRKFQETLIKILPNISGISITGGEPTTDIPLLQEVVGIIDSIVPENMELDLVTNGVCFDRLLTMEGLERFSTIHVSRHAVDDAENRNVFGIDVPTEQELKDYLATMKDPGAVVFNCVLRKDGVSNLEQVREYLEMAGKIGVRNSSFIGLFPANAYCKENYVSPGSLNFAEDSRFAIWQRQHDFDFCHCASGSYDSTSGIVRFYCRWPGKERQDFCRQLVYTADNKLLDGFAGNEICVVK